MAATAVNVSVAVAETAEFRTEVAVFDRLNGAPVLVALGGRVAFTMTL